MSESTRISYFYFYRDFGQHLRDQVKIAFLKGENTKIEDKEKCKRQYESLDRLASNYYGKKYPHGFKKTSSGLSPEACNAALTIEFQEFIKEEDLGFFAKFKKKVKNTFSHYSNQPKPEA